MSSLSCHVLNTTHGVPASGIEVELCAFSQHDCLQKGITDQDGRFRFDAITLEKGRYTLKFHTESYCQSQFGGCFFPLVEVHFIVEDERHYHVPLLLSPYSYSTYRGS
ncbi:hydroxyisourate hydrolase [Vibrio algarum]|uniref:5-hydroxyisourate hydrolase n=1 Tax=Vibrio algarum TaxID=3020714 RepID=A0ABT4YR86_9VIBR|nr:hydroxyisourate hydrolase [Vibrio sp. KJ40-1]MDB1124073.1 hydroxyisourate hydrolase [Vibrio sp. KJ40-1]